MKKILTVFFLFVICACSNANTLPQPPDAKTESSENILNRIDIIEDSLNNINIQLEQLQLKNATDSAKQKKLQLDKQQLTHTKQMLLRQIDDKVSNNNSTTLSIATLVFGLIIMVSILFFQRKKESETNYHPFKLIGLMFIGTVSVFLIPAGFSNNQITPIIGLLGTLAGYLVGSSNSPKPLTDLKTILQTPPVPPAATPPAPVTPPKGTS